MNAYIHALFFGEHLKSILILLSYHKLLTSSFIDVLEHLTEIPAHFLHLIYYITITHLTLEVAKVSKMYLFNVAFNCSCLPDLLLISPSCNAYCCSL
jgi:hypothetical protein